jgi:hypothetical protein
LLFLKLVLPSILLSPVHSAFYMPCTEQYTVRYQVMRYSPWWLEELPVSVSVVDRTVLASNGLRNGLHSRGYKLPTSVSVVKQGGTVSSSTVKELLGIFGRYRR